MMGVDKDLKDAQDRWAERLISEEKFCDAVAIVGQKGEGSQTGSVHVLCWSFHEKPLLAISSESNRIHIFSEGGKA